MVKNLRKTASTKNSFVVENAKSTLDHIIEHNKDLLFQMLNVYNL